MRAGDESFQKFQFLFSVCTCTGDKNFHFLSRKNKNRKRKYRISPEPHKTQNSLRSHFPPGKVYRRFDIFGYFNLGECRHILEHKWVPLSCIKTDLTPVNICCVYIFTLLVEAIVWRMSVALLVVPNTGLYYTGTLLLTDLRFDQLGTFCLPKVCSKLTKRKQRRRA